MKLRPILLSLTSMTLTTTAALAAEITDVVRRPVQAINPLVPLVDVSTAVPTSQEILAVPVPRQGELRAYPRNVLRYGLNVHPGSRIARHNGLFR